MTEIKWNYALAQKGGQGTKEKKDGTTEIIDKTPEYSLTIKMQGKTEDINTTLEDIIRDVDPGEQLEASLKMEGSQKELESNLAEISKMIATQGGQKTLDIFVTA